MWRAACYCPLPMGEFEAQLNSVVQDFVARVSELARRAAINTLEQALSGYPPATAARELGNTKVASRRRPGRRSSDELNALQDAFVKHVKLNPGQRIEEINKALGTTTKDLALRIRKLVSDGVVRTKGERRGTQYFAKN